MISVRPGTAGPDYTGWVDIMVAGPYPQIGAYVGEFSAHFGLELADARRLFGELGDALKVIDANLDPENTD